MHSLYYGVAPGGTVVTKVIKRSRTEDRLEASRTYEPGIPRGQGGQIAHLIIGGMETSLDEIEDLLAAKKERKFTPRRGPGEIADMCRQLIEIRNDKIKYYRKNPSEAPKPKPKVRLHLPVGFRYVQTNEPGLRVLAQV